MYRCTNCKSSYPNSAFSKRKVRGRFVCRGCSEALRVQAHTYDLKPAVLDRLLAKPCRYCGGKATEVDHIKSRRNGGDNARRNLGPACRSCNASKGARPTRQWKRKKRR